MGCPKYLGDVGVETVIYNAQALLAPTDTIFVTEGELDAATLVACGWAAVGLPGAQAWKKSPHRPRLFAGFQRVIVIADGDDKGEEFASAIYKSMPSQVSVILSVAGEDVNSLFVKHGKEGLMALVKGNR